MSLREITPSSSVASIQQTIDELPSEGGVVRLLPGLHFSRQLRLRSGLCLEILPGAVLKAVPELDALPKIQSSVRSRMDTVPWRAFIHADGVRDLRLCGGGTIDGSGDHPVFQDNIENSPDRPYGLHFIDCERVHVQDLTLTKSGFWMQRYFHCRHLTLRGLTVWNHANRNNDGLDIDSCQDVLVSDCRIDASDDGICLKSEGAAPCRNVTVSNCLVASHASAVKTGTGSVGGFENIVINNLVIRRSQSTEMRHPLGHWTGLTGLDFCTTDGGPLRSLIASNITIEGVLNPVLVRLGCRLSGSVARQGYGGGFDEQQGVKQSSAGIQAGPLLLLEDVTISQLVARDTGPYPVIVAGHAGHPVRRVTLRDVTVFPARSGTAADLETEPRWQAMGYPGFAMFGTALPAYGLVTAFTEDLTVENFRAFPAVGDPRPERYHRPPDAD